ncbi:MAG: 30S ribosome-binding factor RbfA [Gammaproteobacteria bacterium]|nr:30S ribosome-binding factor RbfA [Gammaproteobacteria bacterium]
MAALIRRELSTLFAQVNDPAVQGVTVTDVRLSGDMGHARIYCSALDPEQDDAAVKAGLRRATGYLRRQLAGRVKLRIVPQLLFEIDHTGERGADLLQLIDEVCVSETPSASEQ